ncbi:FTR1 family protein [Enterobacter cancerogenus]|uniref:FTR1 family protein n=1 Tax=Enterobacter cancerogenus TaxID=69218 RepID=A0A484XAA3_9ENTR|nr:FTR1 family protein [Enterobacter cancerogenus]
MIAVVILTWMVFWMRKVSRNVKVQLEQAVDNALQKGNHHGWALIAMVFFAVAREGLESVFFLLAAFQQDVGIWPPLGAMLGLATAVVLGFLLYWGGIRLNLGAFFKWTSLFILLVAAGLAAGAIRAFHEAGLWNHFQDVAFNLSGHSLHPFSDRNVTGRHFWLPGNAEHQRSGGVLPLPLFRRWCCSLCLRAPALSRRKSRREVHYLVTTYF